MFSFTPKINRDRDTEFVIRPPEGRIYQVFVTLPEELRRKLYSNLDDVRVIEYALETKWILVRLHQITPSDTPSGSQWYRAIVELNHHSMQHWRMFSNLNNLLQILETLVGYPMEVEIHVFKFHNGKREKIAHHLSHSTPFARLYLHQFVNQH